LHDSSGVASLYREVSEYNSQHKGSLSYIRSDLLNSYLKQSNKVLVWLIWGERGFHYRSSKTHNLYEHSKNYEHIHKVAHVYQPASSIHS